MQRQWGRAREEVTEENDPDDHIVDTERSLTQRDMTCRVRTNRLVKRFDTTTRLLPQARESGYLAVTCNLFAGTPLGSGVLVVRHC